MAPLSPLLGQPFLLQPPGGHTQAALWFLCTATAALLGGSGGEEPLGSLGMGDCRKKGLAAVRREGQCSLLQSSNFCPAAATASSARYGQEVQSRRGVVRVRPAHAGSAGPLCWAESEEGTGQAIFSPPLVKMGVYN